MLSDVEDVHPFSGRLSPVAPVFQGRGACECATELANVGGN